MVTKEKKSFTKLLSSPRPEAVEMQSFLLQYLTEIQELNLSYYWDLRLPKLSAYQLLKQQDAAYKGRLVLATVEALRSLSNNNETLYQLEALLKQLLRLTLSIDSEGFLQLLKLYGISEQANERDVETALNKFPVLLTLSQVEKLAAKEGISEALIAYLKQLRLHGVSSSDNRLGNLRAKIQDILRASGVAELPVVIFPADDLFGVTLNEFVQGLHGSDAAGSWLRLLQLCQNVSGAQPTGKFQKAAAAAVAAVGAENVAA